jgi:murE/murF fusion protein
MAGESEPGSTQHDRQKAQLIFDLLKDSLREAGVAVTNLVVDSREVKPGDVFLAYPGAQHDGRRFIDQAIANGASAILWERAGFEWHDDWQVANSAVISLKALSGTIAHIAYGKPSEQMWVIGVTGTNGKTSCSLWLARALDMLGSKSAVIGTLGSGFPDALGKTSPNTTPDATVIHRELARFLREGAGSVAMEATSIGLVQGRLNSVAFDVALFTNLTRDHLDFHQDMQSYGAAKATLFDWPGLLHGVVNLDDVFGRQLAIRLKGRVNRVGYSVEGAHDALLAGEVDSLLVARNIALGNRGVEFDIASSPSMETARVTSSVLGRFNVSNLLGVAATLVTSGYSLPQIAAVLSRLEPVPGRLERLDPEVPGSKPLVVIDYAHTPDALEKALSALRDVTAATGGKLICVFGCGGNRDRGKRPLMGGLATQLADRVLVTSDNPRLEDPQRIIADILAGCEGEPLVEADRRVAIHRAIGGATAQDVVLFAGKGHEAFQEIDGRKIPFSDAEVAREALAAWVPAKPTEMMSVHQAAAACGGRCLGADAKIAGVGTDSRSVGRGELFVALRGERFDGHEFAAQVVAAGAAAAMVDERAEQERGFGDISRIVVEDTLAGLGRLAADWRARYPIPLLGVLGSNGKTTVKELLASIMRSHYGAPQLLATAGNLNNEIGMPLTLLKLTPQHRCAVIEMGMNHPGEIARLGAIARPTLAVMVNAQREHQEFLHSVEDAARANGEVFAAMPADGVAVLNADDDCIDIWRELAGRRRVVSFGLDQPAVVRGVCRQHGFVSELEIATPEGRVTTQLQLMGKHNARNALAAAAAGWAAGVPLQTIAAGLAAVAPVAGRLQKKTSAAGAMLIDDTYNANPDSVRAAIDVLAGFPAPRILVLGDMGEVGDQGPAFHREIGAYAKNAGVGVLLGLGELMRDGVLEFGAGGAHAESLPQLLDRLRKYDVTGAVVLVKGSRFMKMERVIAALAGSNEAAHGGAH